MVARGINVESQRLRDVFEATLMRWRTGCPKPNQFRRPASVRRQSLLKLWQKIVGLCILAHSVLSRPLRAQGNLEYSKEARLDPQGNVYVSSEEGKLIKMASLGHCSEVIFASDRQTVACAVMRPDLSWTQLEIYLEGGAKETIEPGGLIRDWHFWKDGLQVAVYSGPATGAGTYMLYEAASARTVETLAEPPDGSLLPQWAKSQAQIADESVPMTAALTQERTMWISRVLRQIDKIKPGMRRNDLLKVFTIEGAFKPLPTDLRAQGMFVYQGRCQVQSRKQ